MIIDRAEALARARRLRGLTTDREKLTGFGQVICHVLDMLEHEQQARGELGSALLSILDRHPEEKDNLPVQAALLLASPGSKGGV